MVTDTRTCYRHHDRRAGVLCQRCDRPICSECMNQASVGFHCPECVRGGRQQVRTMRSLNGPPRVTTALIAVNVAVFLYALSAGSSVGRAGRTYLDDWALFGPFVSWDDGGAAAQGAGTGEWWRIVTSGFSHGGLIHLGFNMWALWLLGQAVERSLGPRRFLAAYFAAIMGGSMFALLDAPLVRTVGASGAVYGLFGIVFMAQRRAGVDPWRSGIGGTILLNLIITVTIPNISLGGHVGGLLTGFACGWIYYEGGRVLRHRQAPVVAVLGLAVVLFFGAWLASNTWVDPLFGDGTGIFTR